MGVSTVLSNYDFTITKRTDYKRKKIQIEDIFISKTFSIARQCCFQFYFIIIYLFFAFPLKL